MELKEYQQSALERVKRYLEVLAKRRDDGNRHAGMDAWEELFAVRDYEEKRNGLDKDLPTFCLKIPTGGGKTLLAVKTIDLINTYYTKKQTGLVLWVVPTTQIYQQTVQNLRNREHPYRQQLDIASAGKTIIMERTERFTPDDVEHNLVVLVLMLPAANRKTKDALRMFKDNGSFQGFFPDDDHLQEHNKILERVKNLDVFDDQTNIFHRRQIKTSLGNVLRVLQPIVILDESQKAYSELAKETLYGFNPSIVCELSATPPAGSNVLVNISGRRLNDEEMIKLDLHLINKGDPDWKHTIRAAIEKLNGLSDKAKDYEAETGEYIRPIMVIQVERTGREQRGSGFIHSEDVKEYLVNVVGVPGQEVAIKTSDKDELKDISNEELLSKNCAIKFIITKQALQEGWDCSFAYVLTVLNNPRSQTALTQLVGRILRQPYAHKTGVIELDESYVFTYQRTTSELIDAITHGFEEEGLGDLTDKIVTGDSDTPTEKTTRKISIRKKYEEAVKQILLPMFVVGGPQWRPVSYEIDIASEINWNNVDLSPLFKLKLSHSQQTDKETAIGLTKDRSDEIVSARQIAELQKGSFKPEPVFLARHLMEVVPNPWQAYEISQKVLDKLVDKNSEEELTDNFVYIIQQTLRHLEKVRDSLAKEVFDRLIESEGMRFIVAKKAAYSFPKKREVNAGHPLLKDGYAPLQRSLFEAESADDMNEVEKDVAWFLDDQQKLFFWFRNVDRKSDSYYLQGWQKHKIYPDFLFTTDDNGDNQASRVYIAEVKGEQLLGNEDTEYKENLLALCNDLAEQKEFAELAIEMKGRKVKFEMLPQDEWREKLSEILS